MVSKIRQPGATRLGLSGWLAVGQDYLCTLEPFWVLVCMHYVCMYTYVYAYIYIHIFVFDCICIYIYIRMSRWMMCIYASLFTFVIHVHLLYFMRVYMYIYTHLYT